MNGRQRAEKAIREMPDYWDESYEEIINTFERTINAAIEADRKTRECCKAEREACAEIVHEQYRMWEEEGFKVHECFRDAEIKIRARSEGEKKGE